jgi:hypothetical protein
LIQPTVLKRLSTHVALAIILSSAVGLLLWMRGPLPVTYADWARPHRPSFSYMILAFPLFGSLCAELFLKWREGLPSWWVLAAGIALMCVLAVARLTLRVPVSGHVMLAVFYVIEACRWSADIRPMALIFGWLTLLWFFYVKLHVWGDFVTPLTGAAAGLLIANIDLFVSSRPQKRLSS